MMGLKWTEIALEDYDDCIKYVEKKFSEKKVIEFINEMEHTFDLVLKNPTTFPHSEYKNIRFVVVIKPITLFYTILNSDTVQIVRIWNNRKDKSSSKISL